MLELVFLALLGFVGTGCMAEAEQAAAAADGAPPMAPEALNLNALNLNALNLNALNLNALNFCALGEGALPVIQDPSPKGDLARQLVKYAVGCALEPDESFEYSWKDTTGVDHKVIDRGLLGLAPGWVSTSLSPSEARWISACLASRVNWYSTPVRLSSRGKVPALDHPDADEVATFVNPEGAFWGDLFGDAPALYSCYYEPNIEHSRAMRRDCATGHVNGDGSVVDCGPIHVVGSCDDVCEPLGSVGPYYPTCAAPVDDESDGPSGAAKTSIVVTVFLQ